MQGEQQQSCQDELMDQGGRYDSPDRTTGSSARDGDFGGDQGSDNSGASRETDDVQLMRSAWLMSELVKKVSPVA
jgi:hypothetical protein